MLRTNTFFGKLPRDVIDTLAAVCVKRTLVPGEVLFLQGDPGDALFAVRRGMVRIGIGTDAGQRRTLNLAGPGDVVGEIALLDGRPRTADATAAEPTELLALLRRDFIALLEHHPSFAIRIIELLCERLRWMNDRQEETLLMPLNVRLARRVSSLVGDYGAHLEVSQEELAAFVGATRERVNRQLQKWKTEGLIALGRNRIEVLDRGGLTRAGWPASSS
jgi:CRP-like cAMP-binding protein